MKDAFEKLVDTNKHLRNNCPWDKKQTLGSLKHTVVEEAEEVVQAVNNHDPENLKEELGDLMHNIIFLTNIAEEQGMFDMKDVIEGIQEKLIRRHPHIFNGEKVSSAEEVMAIWEREKQKEKLENHIDEN